MSNRGPNCAIIVAAGRGSRMGDDAAPKQYRHIGRDTVLQKTISCFLDHADIDHVLVVIHPDDADLYYSHISADSKLLRPVLGGSTRQESARNGLVALASFSPSKVLIHDAARPFCSAKTITSTLDAIADGICALPAIAISDTVKKTIDNTGRRLVEKTISRDSLFMAQTPQGFVFDQILNAHLKAAQMQKEMFTDDAAIAEWVGCVVEIVEGSRQNFKITTREDLQEANEIMKANDTAQAIIPDIRTGNGYDVHRLVPGKEIILAGVKIPFHMKLDGHSDADVGLHALTDALLGCIGEGDIGSHFPPSDPQWKGASSDQFLAHACKLVRGQDGVITHLDLTLICEAPKIGPLREKMRQRISQICSVELNRVSVKATTNETIGFIGRQEGIAAIATASVVMTK